MSGMTDFEQMLRDGMAHGAEEAPAPTDLARGARARLRRRRARSARLAAVVGVAAVVAVAIPIGLSLSGADAGRESVTAPDRAVRTTANDPKDVNEVGDFMRTTSWRGITFVVPSEWQRGASTSWCTEGRRPARVTPRIAFPGDPAVRIACEPRSGYGVTVAPAAVFDPVYDSGHVWQYDTAGVDRAMYPDGAWLSYWYDEDWVITVATPSQPLTDRIASSIGADQVDINGCAVAYDEVAVRTSVGPRGVGASLCRYTADGALDDSQRLTIRENEAALAAIAAAPELPGGDHCIQQEGWRITLTPAGQAAYLALYGTRGLGSCQDGLESTVPEQSPSGYVEMTPEVVAALGLDGLPVE